MRRLGLLRLGNCTMAFLGVVIGALVEVDSPYFQGGMTLRLPVQVHMVVPHYILVLLAAVAAFLITGAGNALNDFFDRTIDSKAHPDRPIPSGTVTPLGAWRFAMTLFGLGVILSVLINWWCFFIAVINTLLLVSYELDLKHTGLVGNITISYLTASVFLFGAATVSRFTISIFLFLLALLANLGREVTKDIQDMEADRECRTTLPMEVGERRASLIATVFIVLAVFFSFFPLIFDLACCGRTFSPFPYMLIVVPADVIFIYSCYLLFKDPARAQRWMKVAMGLALVAFLVGGLLG